jgi:signal transduction histidine kinase
MVPIDVNGRTIAYLLPDLTLQFKLNSEEQLFLERSTIAIGLSAVAGVLAALAIGFFLAGTILKPIRSLTSATQELSRGHLSQQVPVTSQDELGQLTATFNQMSADLLHADQERKRMTSDITHDLSTPLQIIAGYVEMLEEEDVTLTPERLEIIKTEIEHLRRLVGDLTTLNQVEADSLDIQPQSLPPSTLLERVYQVYQPITQRQGVALELDADASLPEILVDEGRMMQVLKNLIENACRYTPKGGRITLSASKAGDEVKLAVTDSGSGIDREDLPYVFDRFYQGEKARGANSGKMGLGLAICKALVEAQGGSITADSAGKDHGTSMIMAFPAAKS